MIDAKNLCAGCMNEKVAEGKCPICGYNPDEPVNPLFLSPNSVLEGRYIIGKVIESNGEGVTYLGYDTVTAATVNIREFLPAGLCERDIDRLTVVMLSGCEFVYNDSLLKFTELSKQLFKLNELPALFDVIDVREANNTAYRITRAVVGISLREFLMRNGGILKWDQARSLFVPLISSISALHSAGIIHRGISPDTLIVGKDGKVRLSGFCIADVRTAKSPLTSQLFPGFAAVEQYGAAGTQGTWTDTYAFAATIYRTLVGNPPPEAVNRLENDNMTIPAKIAKETPKSVLETLANALQVLPSDRTPYIDDMRKGLTVSSVQPINNITPVTVRQNQVRETKSTKPQATKSKLSTGKMYGLVAGIVTAVLLFVIGFFVLWILGFFSSDDTSGGTSSNSLSNYSYPTVSTASKAPDMEFEGDYASLPDYVGSMFSVVNSLPDATENIKFKIVRKEFSDQFASGQIISQEPKPGTVIEVGTTVEVVLSLGPYFTKMDDFSGQYYNEAVYELLKQGFDYNNIEKEERYDDTKAPGAILETLPKAGASVNIDQKIFIIVNSYQGPSIPPISNNSSLPGESSSDTNN